MDVNVQIKIAEYRRKVAENNITLEEMKDAVRLLREGRVTVPSTTAARRTKVKAAIPDADALLKELEGL